MASSSECDKRMKLTLVRESSEEEGKKKKNNKQQSKQQQQQKKTHHRYSDIKTGKHYPDPWRVTVNVALLM